MRMLLALAAATAVAGCAAERPAEVSASDEARLTAEIGGRVAGEPVSCVSLRDLRGNRSVGSSAVIFDGPGDLIYVNRASGGCENLDTGRALLLRSPTGRLCSGEIASIVDTSTGMQAGSCTLGEFTPYRRAG